MRLLNFDLECATQSASILFMGNEIDLHNDWSLISVEMDIVKGGVSIRFMQNLGRDPRTMLMVFNGVENIYFNRTDPSERECQTVAGISKVIPGEHEFPHKENWSPEDAFALEIELGGERNFGVLRISSDSVEIV